MEHIRYPEDLFKAQRYQFARYHVTDPGDFYQGNDRWEVPEDPEAANQYQPPYRMFVNLPDSAGDAFSLTSVFVPRGKNNLAAFVSVNSDATSDDYGAMNVLQLPNENTPGPGLIKNEMTTSENVRNELLAFQSGGSRPIYGNLLTLPVEDGLMYVQPVYATRELSDASFPDLEFVIVSYGGEVGIGETLGEALADVLGVDLDEQPDPAGPRSRSGRRGSRARAGHEDPADPGAAHAGPGRLRRRRGRLQRGQHGQVGQEDGRGRRPGRPRRRPLRAAHRPTPHPVGRRLRRETTTRFGSPQPRPVRFYSRRGVEQFGSSLGS